MIYAAEHHANLLNPYELKAVITRLSQKINEYISIYRLRIDAIAFCGMSGSLVAGAISLNLGIPLVMIRKPMEQSSGYDVSGPSISDNINSMNYIIIDDLIVTGSTIHHIMKQMHDTYRGSFCSGIFLHFQRYYVDRFKDDVPVILLNTDVAKFGRISAYS